MLKTINFLIIRQQNLEEQLFDYIKLSIRLFLIKTYDTSWCISLNQILLNDVPDSVAKRSIDNQAFKFHDLCLEVLTENKLLQRIKWYLSLRIKDNFPWILK